VKWLGTAGFELRHGEHVVLIDPYLTRAPLARCVLGRVAPDHARIARHVARADAIVVGHTHFDHALDVPAIARSTGALVLGSRSAVRLCRAAGIPETQLRDVERAPGADPAVVEVGPFLLRFAPSAHSRLVLGRVPFAGEITDCDEVPSRVSAFRCGAVFRVEIEVAGRRIVHLGSAELVESSAKRAGHVDLLLLCAAGWTKSVDLPERVARALSPERILLSHWDDYFRSLDLPARPLPALRMQRLFDRLGAATREAAIGVVPLLAEVAL